MMRIGLLPAVLMLGCAWAGCLRADLKPALAESNLGKRSKLALDNAAMALKAAREAYAKGDNQKVAAAADEIQQSVDLAYDSLMKTGKNPRNSPRWFKPAEISTRELSKKLDTFQQEMDFADRPLLDKVRARVQQVHDELLLGLMEGKRK
jgi:ADP-heptose:LPS heptosyltransferase